MSIVSRLAQLMRDLREVQLLDNDPDKPDEVDIEWGWYWDPNTDKEGHCKFSVEIIYADSFCAECNNEVNNAFREEFPECKIEAIELLPQQDSPVEDYSAGLLIVVY